MNQGARGIVRAKALSALAVEKLAQSAFVGGAPGLELRVTTHGIRSWRLFYRLPGDPRRRAMKLGPYPTLSLADARKRAHEALARVTEGLNPRVQLQVEARRAGVTVSEAFADYLRFCANENTASTVLDKRRLFQRYAERAIGGLQLESIRRGQLMATIDAIQGKQTTRRMLYATLRHFMGWATDRDLVEINVLAGIRPPRATPPRDRFLSDDEIRGVWAAGGQMADLARLALLTAQRLGSLETMRWSDLDFDNAVWRIPRDNMKSGKAHEVPLAPLAMQILRARPRMKGSYIFGVGSEGMRPYKGASNGMEELRRELYGRPAQNGKRLTPAQIAADRARRASTRIDAWRFHDLRRTAVTLAQRAGAPLDAIRALTQHKTPGIIGVYARHAYTDEKRDVAERINAIISAIIEGRRA